MNYLKLLFIFFAISHILLGIFVNWFEKYLPSFILNSYRYGKLIKQKHFRFDFVPKSWFRHFYVFSSIFSLLASILIFSIHFNFIDGIPEQLRDFFDFIGGPISKPNVSRSASFIAILLMTMQCFRRFYETHFISVYSDAKMSFGLYLVGILHYFGAILAIVCETPGILNKGEYGFVDYGLKLKDLCAVLIFLWANKTQFVTANILGQLRKNDKGNIKSLKYHIPHGRYFELVSCPHMMCEIIIYLCLWVILWGNSTWPYVAAWVVGNQVECALLCHWWYQGTFSNYPKARKAVIPYIL